MHIQSDAPSGSDPKSHVVSAITTFAFILCFDLIIECCKWRDLSLVSLGLQKKCKVSEVESGQYETMIPLSDIPNVQPEGYLVRMPFYILAERDAKIAFSETENPDWLIDGVYEVGKYREFTLFLIMSSIPRTRTAGIALTTKPVTILLTICFYLISIVSYFECLAIGKINEPRWIRKLMKQSHSHTLMKFSIKTLRWRHWLRSQQVCRNHVAFVTLLTNKFYSLRA